MLPDKVEWLLAASESGVSDDSIDEAVMKAGSMVVCVAEMVTGGHLDWSGESAVWVVVL